MSDKTHSDLRRLTAERPNFSAAPQSLEPFFAHHNQLEAQYSPAVLPKFEPLLVRSEGGGLPSELLPFGRVDNSNGCSAAGAPVAAFFRPNKVMDSEYWGSHGNDINGGNGNGNGRWPRQETLTLLEIRSRLDSKFKESNQKGPLWDQVSRMMAEEYGYNRSGKKCKEKFDNLYKYYKKTKEPKTGRQDGKHYRFFRQLEAIYGECSDQLSHDCAGIHREASGSLGFSVSSDFETSSSGNYHDDDLSAIAFMMNKKGKENVGEERKGVSWKKEVENLVDSKLSRLMETQEIWIEKMVESVEVRERERMMRDEEWRRREEARFENEMHEFCARERAWLEAREASLMEVVKKFTGKE